MAPSADPGKQRLAYRSRTKSRPIATMPLWWRQGGRLLAGRPRDRPPVTAPQAFQPWHFARTRRETRRET